MDQPPDQPIPPEPSQPDRPPPDGFASWPEFWQVQGMLWRTEPEIDAEQQRDLAERRAINPDIYRGLYPFKGIKLTRADVEWLLATHESGGMRGPVDWTDPKQYTRPGLDFRGADLRGQDLSGLPLTGMYGGLLRHQWFESTAHQRAAAAAHLEDANLRGTHLEDTQLRDAHLEQAYLRGARLAGADLSVAHLEGASFFDASLKGEPLNDTQWLSRARQKTGRGLIRPPTDLHLAFFDGASSLSEAILGDRKLGGIRVADTRWNGVNLGRAAWEGIEILQDEYVARESLTSNGKPKDEKRRLGEHQEMVRAYRQLAITLREQGVNEDADRFAYRAQFLQRLVLKRQGQWLRYLGSVLLDLISGYGYRPLRSLLTYVLVVVGFAVAYYFLGVNVHPALLPVDALVFSITSFHGRGFSPGEMVSLHNPLSILAACEAIIGLLIEITFIATFTQRFFAR